MQYIERVNSDITYTPQISQSLNTFTELTNKTIESIDAEWNRVTITMPITPDTPKAFFRVNVELN